MSKLESQPNGPDREREPPPARTVRRWRRGCLPALPLLFLSAAAAAQDTLVIRADNPPVWGEELRLVEELRVGALDGPPEHTFGDIPPVGIVVQDDGVIWVADRHALTIRRFRPDGSHIDDIGRSGRGPGEFESIDGIDRLPDGRIAVLDARHRRVTVLSADGEPDVQFTPSVGLWAPRARSFRADTAARLWIFDWGRGDRDSRWWRRHSVDGEALDSVPVPPHDRDGPAWARQDYGYATMYGFGRMTLSSPSPHGFLVVGRNAEYAIHRPLDDGRVQRIERAWSPVAVRRGERASFQALEDHFSRRRGVSSGTVPREKPPYWHLWVDRQGRIWVARHGEGEHVPETAAEREDRERFDNPPREWWEPLVYDVITPTGTFLGSVRFPNRQTDLMAARDDRLWVVERGEYDEQYVVRYRIEGG